MKFRRIGASALVVLAIGTFVVACGDDDDTTAGGDDTTETTAATGGDEIPEVTISATDDLAAKKFTFDVPSDIPGGVVGLELKNEGKELHDFQLVEAVDGHSLDEILAEVSSEDAPLSDWVVAAGGPGSTAPGGSSSAIVDLTAGTYWYFCTESSGGDEEGSESVSHGANGMAGEFTVGDDSGAEMPDAGAAITAKDYAFETSGLKAGKNTVAFSNEGPKQIHHAYAFPIAEGKTFDEAKTFLMSDAPPEGEPPVDFESGVGTTVISSGRTEVVELDLKAGTYALLCFMPDLGTAGPPHLAKGMLVELKIG
jgi:hypothetical protein